MDVYTFLTRLLRIFIGAYFLRSWTSTGSDIWTAAGQRSVIFETGLNEKIVFPKRFSMCHLES